MHNPRFAHFSNSQYKEFATENTNLENDTFQNLTVELNLLHCEIEMLFATLVYFLCRLYPG